MTGIEELLTWDNPVFTAYAITAAILVLKVMGQGWMTVWRMMRSGRGLASPEDAAKGLLNPAPDPGQPHHQVRRGRDRGHRQHGVQHQQQAGVVLEEQHAHW